MSVFQKNLSPEPEEYESDRPSAREGRPEAVNTLISDVLKRWYWVIPCLIIGALSSAYYLSKAPEEYAATTSLLIKQRTASVMGKDRMEEISLDSTEGLNTIAERIRRLDLLEQVASRQDVRDLPGIVPPTINWLPDWANGAAKRKAEEDVKSGTLPPVPSPRALAGQLAGKMTVSIRKGTRLLDITFVHWVPEVAKALADGVAREYLAEITGAKSTDRTSILALLDKESNLARTKLESVNSARGLYAKALEQMKALETQEAKIQGLTARYRAKHPAMLNATKELAAIQANFLREFDYARAAPAEAEYWKTAGPAIDKAGDDMPLRLQASRQALSARDRVLESENTSQTAVFQSMLTQIQNSSINQKGNESEVEVSSLARVPGVPSSPVPSKIYGTGIMGGLMGGLGLAFLFAKLDNQVHTVAQLEGLTGCSVLAAVAHLPAKRIVRAEREFAKKAETTSAPPPPSLRQYWAESLLFRDGVSETIYAEMFRQLRVSVSLLGDVNRRKVTLFTSAVPGEGKSTVSANFALANAAQGKRTLLIDLDLRKPSLHRLFALPFPDDESSRPGVAECLAGQMPLAEAVVYETGQDNLNLLFSGARVPNPGELLNASRLVEIFQEASLLYDVIVVDSAPLLSVPDTRLIAPLVNNVCVVVRAEYTPKGAVTRAIEILDEAGTPPVGVVFNGFRENRSGIGGNYTYGYYQNAGYGRAYQYGYGSNVAEAKKPKNKTRSGDASRSHS